MELATKTDAERMAEIFAGFTGAHGVYDGVSDTPDDRGKRTGSRIRTVHCAATLADFENHLLGVSGLGIVPIRADSTASFGALDVDSYDLNLQEIASRIARLGLPLVPCRSKSGGLHCYLHVSEPVPAKHVIERLRQYRALLGFPADTEVFPKQAILSEDSKGSWINIPYQNGLKSGRYAIAANGDALSITEWLALVIERRVTPDDLKKPLAASNELPDGPPCLQSLVRGGFPAGCRNNGLLALGTYARRANPDGWQGMVDSFNQKYLQPPLLSAELVSIIKSLRKTDYSYRCSDSPLAACCDKPTCIGRKYGTGVSGNQLHIKSLSKLDVKPPVFFALTVWGNVRVDAKQLMDPYKFSVAVAEQANAAPPLPKLDKWREHIHGLLQSAEVIPAPEDASEEGSIIEHIRSFCTGRAQAEVMDEILLNRPFTEGRVTTFMSVSLLAHMKRKGIPVSEGRLYEVLRGLGGSYPKDALRLKGRRVRVWTVPEFDQQSEPFDLPRAVAQGAQDAF